MSGTVRVRKQWQVQDGPKGTLRRLRCQLAEDGCVESQVVIAKQLLEEAQLGGDWTEQSSQAVYWLIRAAEYGSEEATALLQHCYRSGTGITKENWTTVRACLLMTPEEKELRTAARDLFVSLTPFGQDFVTSQQLLARLDQLGPTRDGRDAMESPVRLVTGADVGDSSVESSSRSGSCSGGGRRVSSGKESPDSSFTKWYEDSGIFDGQCLTEARLIEAASRVARGEVPDVSLLDDRNDKTEAGKVSRFQLLQRIRQSCVARPAITLDLTAWLGETVVRELLSWGWARTVLLVLMCNALSLDAGRLLLPAGTFYAALALMTLSTVQLLRHSRGLRTVECWVRLFRTAHAQIDAGRVQRTFHRRRLLRCYGRFFVATLLALLAFPLVNSTLLPRADLATFAAGLAIASLVAVDRSRRHLLFFSLLLVASCLSRATTRPLSLPPPTTSTATLQLSLNLVLVWSPHAWPAMTMVAYLSWSAHNHAWHGTYRTALPDLVTLVWSQMAATLLSDGAWQWLDLSRGVVAWLILLALPALVALLLTALGLFAAYRAAMLVVRSDQRPSIAVLTALVVVGTWWCRRRPLVGHPAAVDWRGRLRRRLPVLAVACAAILLATVVLRGSMPVTSQDKVESPEGGVGGGLSWDTYHRICHQPARYKVSTAVVAEKCSHLAGANVRWRGQVREVNIAATTNRVEDLLARLPSFLAEQLRCALGSTYRQCSASDSRQPSLDEEDDEDEGDGGGDDAFSFWYCDAMSGLRDRCHVRHYDRHELELVIRIRSDGYWNAVTNVLVGADDAFRDFVLLLVPGDEVSFAGELLRAASGTPRPTVRLEAVSCEDCSRRELRSSDGAATRGQYREAFHRSLGFVVEHVFHPFLRYRPA